MGMLRCPTPSLTPISDCRSFGALWGRTLRKTKNKAELPPLGLVGEEIGKARQQRCLTTLEVSEKPRIPERFVQCVESGDFASLPGKPFVLGFTRTICSLLGLDADKYVATIKSEMYGYRADEASIAAPPRGPDTVLRRLKINWN